MIDGVLLAAQWHTPVVQRHVQIDKLVYRSQQWHPTCLRLVHPISESLETVVPVPPRARTHDIYITCCHRSGDLCMDVKFHTAVSWYISGKYVFSCIH